MLMGTHKNHVRLNIYWSQSSFSVFSMLILENVLLALALIKTYCSSMHFSSVRIRNNTNSAVNDEKAAKKYLQELEPRYTKACAKEALINWQYETNLTQENEDASNEAANELSEFKAGVQKEINEKFSGWKTFKDPQLVREFKNLAITGPADMPKDDVEAMHALLGKMESAYSSATVCEYKNPTNCSLNLEPELTHVLKTSTDYNELDYYWTAWHDTMGSRVSADDFETFAKYQNDMAVANGFNDMGELWAFQYDDGSKGFNAKRFMTEMGNLWEKLKPNYSKLHAYVRMKLRSIYKDQIDKDGHIFANIFGNMWAQDWTSLDRLTKPYPETPNLDATDAMVAAKYDVQKMFREADKFFGGLGLFTMTDTFWKKSMFTKPEGRDVVCHASATDFCAGKTDGDFRIKMCTQVNMEDLVTIHHEMGHIEYYMQYENENYIFRSGANPGFHEAIGDALGLAVTTPAHLTCVLGLDLGLNIKCDSSVSKEKVKGRTAVNDTDDDLPKGVTKTDINFLYLKALEKFSFYPFGLFIDIWRFEVFSGKLKKDKYNDRWWELRKEYQGIVPPKKRKSSSFDPAAKYHIVGNVEYIGYFVSFILQFQLFEAMCIAAGEYSKANPKKPLYQCDFTDSKEAGKVLGDMMKLGYSKPWPEALEKIAKTKTLSIEPLMNYFKPLFDKITKDLKKGKERPCFGKQNC